jgi:hypothetical protein
MKLSNAFIVTILAIFLFITGCKEKSAKEMILKKWKFTEISGPDAKEIPDSIRAKMIATTTMEFKKDGTYEQTGGMSEHVQIGTYSLTEDGKTIIIKDESSNPDTVMVLELSESKLVLAPKTKDNGRNMQLTMKPN